MKINIGAGDTRLEGYINCDHDPLTDPDHLVDLEKDKLPFDDNSVDTVVAHHVLEHLGEGYFHCLQEIYRVCKHGAIVSIIVPHHAHESFWADPTHRRPITVLGLQLFSKKFNQYCKENSFASSRLAYYYRVDFEVLDFRYIPDDRVKSKMENWGNAQIEDYAAEHWNIIKEIHVKLVVIKE